ncbi:MAG: hypothetical protein K6E28_00730 [Eubacterium sp.]|nr:hypothetical protein [Eubacterium sp.]
MKKIFRNIAVTALALSMGLSLAGCGTRESGKGGFYTAKGNINAEKEAKMNGTEGNTEDVTEAVAKPQVDVLSPDKIAKPSEGKGDGEEGGNDMPAGLAEVVGDWLCVGLEKGDQKYDRAKMEELQKQGMYVYMTVKEDGAANLYVFSEGITFQWTKDGFVKEGYTGTVDYSVDGNTMTFGGGETESIFYFEKVNNIQSVINGNGDTDPGEDRSAFPNPASNWVEDMILSLHFSYPDNFELDEEDINEDGDGFYNKYYVLRGDNGKVYHSIDVFVIDKTGDYTGIGAATLEEMYTSEKDEGWEFLGFNDGSLPNVTGNVRIAESISSEYYAPYEYCYIFEDDTYIYEIILGDVDELSSFRLGFEGKVQKN